MVNKLDAIDTKFRFFRMELLAGVPDYVVEHASPFTFSSLLPLMTMPLNSVKLTAASRSTLPKFTGIPDSLLSMNELSVYSNQKTL